MRLRTMGVALAATAAAMAFPAGTAFADPDHNADHAHYVIITDPQTGETKCQYVANGRSGPGGAHHSHVHTGQPGSDDKGSDFDRDSNEASRCDEVRGGS